MASKIDSTYLRPFTGYSDFTLGISLRSIFLFALKILVLSILLSHNLRDWFIAINHLGIYLFLLSGYLAFLVTPVIKFLAFRFAVLDFPEARKIHSSPTPLWGGLAIYMAFIMTLIFNLPIPSKILGIIVGATLLIIIGVLDDIKGLPARLRLLVQIIAALIVIKSGICLEFVPNEAFGVFIEIFFTVLWIVGITNAFNFFDGMDGLSAGIGLIAAFFFALVAIQTNQLFLMYLSLSLIGACAGFLPFNLRYKRPASIFLGDTGSTLIGFVLASLAVMGEWANNNPIKAFSMPLLIFGVLIFDLIYISIARIVTKQVRNFKEWLEFVGKDHLHHRLAAMGLSNIQSVFLIFFLSIVMGLSAIILKNGRTIDAVLGLIQMASVLIIISILMKKGGELLHKPEKREVKKSRKRKARAYQNLLFDK
ncbi:MAG: MraY family glycosyltransferase [bacterium]